MYKLKVKKLDPSAKLPTVAHPGEDLAYDLYALEDTTLEPGKTTKVRTGIAVEMLARKYVYINNGKHFDGYRPMGLIIKDRSSIASLGVFTHAGVVDAGYRGEIVVVFTAGELHIIKAGAKIAQMIPVYVTTGAVEETDCLSSADRGGKGFGSSGR